MRSVSLFAALLALFVVAAGCSISKSSESLSKSSSSPFKWSSSSSPGDGDPEYEKEVEDYAFAYARSGGDVSAFRRGVGAIAERRGITDWEGDDPTVRSIGAGLRQSGIGRAEAESFAGELFVADRGRVEVLLKGYDRAG